MESFLSGREWGKNWSEAIIVAACVKGVFVKLEWEKPEVQVSGEH